MRFLKLVIICIFFLFFLSIEVKAQRIKKVTDKSFYSDDVLFGKLLKSAQDTVKTKEKEHNELNEVVIKRQASLLKYGANGNIDVNVNGTVLATSSSVNELLGRVPNVVVADGEINVLGKGEAIIYLNGVLINYERFAAIPVSQIQKIEVISNPSSRYDAEGKAVINIITKQNIESGIMGTANQHVSVSKFGGTSYNTLFDFSYSKGKFSFISNYGLQLGRNRELLYTTRTRPNPEEFMKSELTTDWKRRFNNYSNFGFGLQYNFSSQAYISLAYSGNVNDLGGITESRNAIVNNSGNSFYATDVHKNDVLLNQFINLNYNLTTKKGSTLFVGSQFSNYNQTIRDFIEENSLVEETDSDRYLKNNVGSRINIMAIQTDYSKKINEKTKLELGAKFSYAAINSGTDFLVSSDDVNFELDDKLSSDFEYNEKIAAAYFNYVRTWNDKINFSLGARAEKTSYNLFTNTDGIQKFEKSYGNFFPNLVMNFDFSEDWKGHFSYAARITRPRYQALNPYVIYQDPFTTIEGNPNLLPEKTHAFEIGTMYKKFDFKMGYTYKIDPISAAALRGDTPNSYILRALNLEKGHTVFSSLSRSFNYRWWNSTNTISVSWQKSVDNYYAFVFSPVKPQFYFYSNNTFTIPKLFKLQLLAWYLSDRSYGLGNENSRSTVTLGIERNFFKDALKLNFSANDIFHKFMVSGDYNVGQTQIYYHRTYASNYFKLIATYNFGNSKKTTYTKSEIEQSENTRAR
ncbi:TonB-dependent receptor domain-containing protein [Flavobacterium quisquiliarum]|uniref:TonB-dependent receptor domain-containing protein n=1 Tax=Flavobacterium quisquiliarum TaxID=1834436 RepID=A0ABV8WAH8_9FLAO|nr:TonB-dependent receptor [Flavobacterium quisquiliarum]MBW1658095.1 TonB-dependent receptor [Flavobacterium quisquiliarum]NWK99866.1 TonB-dependent receptor [Flavobacterium collinsii]